MDEVNAVGVLGYEAVAVAADGEHFLLFFGEGVGGAGEHVLAEGLEVGVGEVFHFFRGDRFDRGIGVIGFCFLRRRRRRIGAFGVEPGSCR